MSSLIPDRDARLRSVSTQTSGIRMAVPPAEVALRVEDVAVEPEIGFGQPAAAGPGVGQQREGTLGVPRRLGDQGEAAGGHRLPARIAELAGPGEGLLKESGRPGRIVPGQLHLTPQRLRPRQERQPVVIARPA